MAVTTNVAALLAPLLALVLWTFLMEIWMYAYRISAVHKYKIKMSPHVSAAEMNAKIPRPLQFPADNYNHLHEQPTVFYAVVLALALLGEDNASTVRTAWAYVVVRVCHSLIQATVNKIMLRFSVFLLSSAVLLALTLRTATLVF